MNYRRIVITGGAGFIGSSYAIWLAQRLEGARIVAVDNLKRRGAELNLPRLRSYGIEFVHGDIRNAEDLQLDSRQPEVIIECSAEPSVLAGYGAGSEYVVRTNLFGTVNCLELARRCHADVVFLSTSRVYPIALLNSIAVEESAQRFDIAGVQEIAGVSRGGIAETFPLNGVRSLYGATKLASEMLLHEYAEMNGFRAVINRCGVVAGPWQMAKVDQGVFALWAAAHRLRLPLRYIGWGGEGKQVRDCLFIDDLCELLDIELSRIDELSGQTFNVGGGPEASASLLETSRYCERITGNRLMIRSDPETRPGDVRLYITDNSLVHSRTRWQPRHGIEHSLSAIDRWITENAAVRYLWES
jgi:CDP-paratose 2-epimerase